MAAKANQNHEMSGQPPVGSVALTLGRALQFAFVFQPRHIMDKYLSPFSELSATVARYRRHSHRTRWAADC